VLPLTAGRGWDRRRRHSSCRWSWPAGRAASSATRVTRGWPAGRGPCRPSATRTRRASSPSSDSLRRAGDARVPTPRWPRSSGRGTRSTRRRRARRASWSCRRRGSPRARRRRARRSGAGARAGRPSRGRRRDARRSWTRGLRLGFTHAQPPARLQARATSGSASGTRDLRLGFTHARPPAARHQSARRG
jgi:hypothetical protein